MQLTIDKYTKMVAPLDVRDLDLPNAFHTQRLDADVLRCLRYMHDIELHTICYLRDLLVTSAHRDPEITTFLWIGDGGAHRPPHRQPSWPR